MMIQYNGTNTQGWLKGSSLARHCGSYLRRSDAQGSDEDQEGSHCQQKEAHDRSAENQDSPQGWLQAEEGNLQALQEVNE